MSADSAGAGESAPADGYIEQITDLYRANFNDCLDVSDPMICYDQFEDSILDKRESGEWGFEESGAAYDVLDKVMTKRDAWDEYNEGHGYSLPSHIIDEAGVLDEAGRDDAGMALAAISNESELELFVTFVDSFDGAHGADWAERKSTEMGQGTNDLLLAVAVKDYAWGLARDTAGPLSEEQADRVADAAIERLEANDFSGAVTAAADVLVGYP